MYTMKQACQQVGMTYETLKFYCNEGLIPNVKRDKNNYRIFDDRNIQWIKNLSCLKKCGMSIEDMKRYLSLCLEGPDSIPERRLMLDKQRNYLIGKIKELNEYVDYIDWKQQLYSDMQAGKIAYHSNLIPSEERQ
ncbi:MAG: MerR family transcriptional regulator [Clostridiales bacterium]|nr:MerR family transcriptional regulator [Clostridiales bacterium]